MADISPPPSKEQKEANAAGGDYKYDPETGQVFPANQIDDFGQAGDVTKHYVRMSVSGAQQVLAAPPGTYDAGTLQAAQSILQMSGLSPNSQPGAVSPTTGLSSTAPNLGTAKVDPDRYKLIQMHLAALANQAYRPEMAQARTNALGSQLSAYEPMNNVLGAMYGPAGKIDLSRAAQSPMSAAMMRLGAPNQNDIGIAPPGSPNAAGYIQGPKGIPASAAAPTSYPDASLTIGPPPLRRGPDGKLYDAQGRPVPG